MSKAYCYFVGCSIVNRACSRCGGSGGGGDKTGDAKEPVKSGKGFCNNCYRR